MLAIVGDGRLERIQPHAKFSVGRERTQRRSAQSHGVDCFVYRNVPLFGGVHCPAIPYSVVLYAVARNRSRAPASGR